MNTTLKSKTLASLAVMAGLATLCPNPTHAAAFTPGNLVVERLGDGSASLTSAGTAIFLDEYTTSGTLVQSIALPTATGSGSTPNPLTDSGTATSAGLITRSTDGKYIVVPGYAGAAGLAGIVASSASRCVGVVKYDGSIDTTTAFTDGFVANSERSVASTDGNSLWMAGNGGTGNKGARYTTKGSSTTVNIDSTPNARCAAIYGGNLLYNSQTVMYKQTGTPTTATAPATITFSGTAPASMYQFVVVTVSGSDVAYIADDTSATGGVFKYSISGTTWTYLGKVTGTSLSIRGVTASVSGSTVTLYVSSGGTGGASGGGSIYVVTDTAGPSAAPSSTSFPTAIVTAGSNKAFRGIALAPVAYSVTYNANGGTGSQTDSSSPYAAGATVTVLGAGTITRAGYTFTGWNTAANGSGTGYSAGNTFTINANTTLYAQWTFNTPPSIGTQPTAQNACSGSTATFTVSATGSSLHYSWAKHNNAGWGSAWSVSGSGGTFRSSSTGDNVGDSVCTSFTSAYDINSPSGNALGMYCGGGTEEAATRSFTALTAGQVVSIDFDNGNVDNGKKVGFSLQKSDGTDLLQFYFLGGASNYKYWDSTGERDTGSVGFLRTGVRAQFVLGAGNTYTLIVTRCGGTANYYSGTYAAGSIAKLKLFNQNGSGGGDYDCYFNNFIVGGYVDNADNYTGGGGWAGVDAGDQAIASGNGSSSYTTPTLTTGDNGNQYEVVVYGSGGAVLSSTASLTVNTAMTWASGGSLAVTVTDATGTPGWTQITPPCDLIVSATNNAGPSGKFTINLGGTPANFSSGSSYQWAIAIAGGTVQGFNANKFILNTSGFSPTPSGQFSLALVNQSVMVVYTPTSCTGSTTASALVVGSDPNKQMQMTFINSSGLSSVQALVTNNCYITGTAYDSGDNSLGSISQLSMTARTSLPANTVKVVLLATKFDTDLGATVNVLAIDSCGRGASFDPVITTLEVLAGDKVVQRFEGLLAAERYLFVKNGTPGLRRLEVNLNGRVFTTSLSDGQTLASDLGRAMHEGSDNVVILTGYGDVGSSAFVTLTDTATGNEQPLAETVTLSLAQTADGLRLAWPDTLAGWNLEASTSASDGWAAVTAVPVPVNGQLTVTVPTTGGAQFYRLHGPVARSASEPQGQDSSVTLPATTISTPNSPMKYSHENLLW